MLKGKNIYLRPFDIEDAEDLLRLQKKNQSFFDQFSGTRPSDYYTLKKQEELIQKWEKGAKSDTEYQFGIYRSSDDTLLGTINLFQVLRGNLQSAFIGYFLDKEFNGNGYTTGAAKLIVEYAFESLNLHRIEAGVMPHNIASIRVLEKAGFHKEGLAKKNVQINGQWEDHVVLAIINPND
ncbi:GNAT family N-acetyltransferase [Mesobacillus zeae]|uniref:N-acetyltransferase n=1 Tax=Mesobacillus zeae TaxID=1917180 RepID=A0A398BA73_9BACI|nr:GNAT family protein [Mesobacillus zeae]RID85748.1 N-acetyltransferase [Mesobacillus zeae]